MKTNTLTVEFNCSCAWPMTESAQKAFSLMSDTEKVEAVNKILKARNTFTADTNLGKQAKELLTTYFGEGFSDKSDFKGQGRLMFTLDLSRRFFRCWYASFGSVSVHESCGPVIMSHFDSCGQGMFIHIQGSDQEVLENLVRTLTRGMVEWKSQYGTLWAGWKES